MSPLLKRAIRLVESYVFVLLVAWTVGIVFADHVAGLSAYGKLFLMGIFFLSALRLEFADLAANFRDMKLFVVVNVLMMIVFPIVVFSITNAIAPDLALAFLLIAAMPAGMTSALLTEINGGNQGLALVLTVSTSLLAPLTVPLVIQLLAGAQVDVSFWSMALSLAKVILLPFVLAQAVKFIWGRTIRAAAAQSRPVSMILLGLLITGIIAGNADTILASIRGGRALLYFGGLLLLFAAHLGMGYYATYWRARKDRIAVMVCLTFMNFTLAIFLAGQYFPEPNVLVPVILSVLPWSLLLIPFRAFARAH